MPHETTDQPAAPGRPSLLYAVKQVELAVRAHLDALLAPSGVTALQYTAMTVLQRRADLTAAELARNSFVTTQSTADLVAALHRRGLLTRRRDPADGRRVLLRLSEEGAALVQRHAAQVAELEARMTAELDAHEVEALRSALNSCRSALAAGPGGGQDVPPHRRSREEGFPRSAEVGMILVTPVLEPPTEPETQPAPPDLRQGFERPPAP